MKRRINKQGYFEVYFPEHQNSNKEGYILEHRLICEIFIGRKLKTSEPVHHIDLNKKNNNINNLMPFKNQKEHANFHIKLSKFKYMTNPMKRQIRDRWIGWKK